MHKQSKENPFIIVFFDGYCGLCSWAVDFLMARDKHKKFKYSPLQGQYVKSLGLNLNLEKLDTLYVYHDGITYEKTHALRKLAVELGGVWDVLGIISIIFPVFVWSFIYDQIAKNRYKIFGKRETCRLPTAEEQDLFLP